MEINLLYQINTSSSKSCSFLLFNDQLILNNKTKKQSDAMKSYHISSLSYPQTVKDHNTIPLLQIDILLKNEKLLVSSELNSVTTLNSFRKVLGYLKQLYYFALAYDIFIENQIRYFSPKEYVDKLSNYVNEYTLFTILKKINETNDLKGLFEAVHSKFEDYENSLMPVFNKKKIETKQSMVNDFKNTFMTMYENLSIKPDDYGRKQEIVVDPQITFMMKHYYDLSKILLEVRNSLLEVRIRENNLLMKNDIVFLFCLLKNKVLNKAELEKEQVPLNNKLSASLKGNYQLKKEIQRRIEEKGNQLFVCFKCGFVLFQTEITASTCRYDDKCTKYSMFNCRKCNVAYCTYCVSYYKNSKCAYGHLLFEFEDNRSTKICAICFTRLTEGKDIAGCKICQLPICKECNKTRATLKLPTCSYCSHSLGWRRGRYTECSKCHLSKDCFWFCFFCSIHLCIECQPTIKNYCGALHQMSPKGFNNESLIDFYLFLDKINQLSTMNDYMNNPFSQPNTSCAKCKEVFQENGSSCQRCSFLLCQTCSNA